MNNLPKQVRLQVEQADQLLAAVNVPPAEPPAPPATVPEPAPAPEPAAAPAADVQPGAPAQAPAPAATAPSGDPEKTWEARYKTLQGMHNRNIADMRQRMQALEQERDALKAQQASKPADKPADKPEVTLDPKDAETFGADLVGMAKRVAETVATAVTAKFEARIAALEQQQSGTSRAVAQTAEDVFLARLRQLVPDYAAQNEDESFLAWLAEVDPVYGVPRQEGLNAATQALDADRTARIFLAYRATVAPVAAAPEAAPRQPASQSLERQVAPGASAQPAPLQPQSEPPISTADVRRFYDDVRRGVYRGRQEEMLRNEAAINKALAEGRILDSVPRRPV